MPELELHSFNTPVGPDGVMVRHEHGHATRVKASPNLIQVMEKTPIPGVFCENPDEPTNTWIFRKDFINPDKEIFLPHEADAARKRYLHAGDPDSMVLGMTGYSSISPENLEAWGLEPYAYENACMDFLGSHAKALQRKYDGIWVAIAHGASAMGPKQDLGVDAAAMAVAKKLHLSQLGHNCPNYMLYVEDDSVPILVSPNSQQYSDDFIKSFQILLSVGGRVQALKHDIAAAIEYDKFVIPLDLLSVICKHGGPPARDNDGKIINATAAYLNAVAQFPAKGRLSYQELKESAIGQAIENCRRKISPERAYADWENNDN